MSFGPIVGIRLEIYDQDSAPPYAAVLKDVLGAAFDGLIFGTNKDVDRGSLRLTVGSKKPSWTKSQKMYRGTFLSRESG